MNSLISSTFTFNVNENVLHVTVDGFKDGKIISIEDSIEEKGEGVELRKLFLAQAGKVKGEFMFLRLSIDFLLMTTEGIVISYHEGKFINKNFRL
jgi:hypothetical protein